MVRPVDVISPGASRGIGAELAYQLAAQGARLALAARDASRLETVAGRCQGLGAEVVCIPTDVTDPDQCRSLVERTVEAYDRVDTLIGDVRALPRMPGVDRIHLPGEPEWHTKEHRTRTGIPLPPALFAELQGLATKYQVDQVLAPLTTPHVP